MDLKRASYLIMKAVTYKTKLKAKHHLGLGISPRTFSISMMFSKSSCFFFFLSFILYFFTKNSSWNKNHMK